MHIYNGGMLLKGIRGLQHLPLCLCFPVTMRWAAFSAVFLPQCSHQLKPKTQTFPESRLRSEISKAMSPSKPSLRCFIPGVCYEEVTTTLLQNYGCSPYSELWAAIFEENTIFREVQHDGYYLEQVREEREYQTTRVQGLPRAFQFLCTTVWDQTRAKERYQSWL